MAKTPEQMRLEELIAKERARSKNKSASTTFARNAVAQPSYIEDETDADLRAVNQFEQEQALAAEKRQAQADMQLQQAEKVNAFNQKAQQYGLPTKPLPANTQPKVTPTQAPQFESDAPVEQTPRSPSTAAPVAQNMSTPKDAGAYGLKMKKQGIQEEANALSAQAEDNAALYEQRGLDIEARADKMVARQDERQEFFDEKFGELEKATDAFSKMEIKNPDVWGDASAGRKVALAITGLMSALTPRSTEGYLKIIDNYIDRDIATQKANIQKAGANVDAQKGLYAMYRQKFGDDDAAEAATWMTHAEQFKNDLEKRAAQATTKVQQARAKQLIGAADVEIQDRKQQFELAMAKQFNERAKQNQDFNEKMSGKTVRVGNFEGYAPTEKQQIEFTELASDQEAIRNIVTDLKQIAKQGGAASNPKTKAETQAKVEILNAMVGKPIFGIMTVGEKELVQKIVADPTEFFSMPANEIAKFDAMVNTLDERISAKAKGLGLQDKRKARDSRNEFRAK